MSDYRLEVYCHNLRANVKFFDSKDELINYFNHNCTSSSSEYFYELWHKNTLLFSTEDKICVL